MHCQVRTGLCAAICGLILNLGPTPAAKDDPPPIRTFTWVESCDEKTDAALLTPPQIIELACVVGFWKMYNTIHDSLRVPIEAHLLEQTGYVDV